MKKRLLRPAKKGVLFPVLLFIMLTGAPLLAQQNSSDGDGQEKQEKELPAIAVKLPFDAAPGKDIKKIRRENLKHIEEPLREYIEYMKLLAQLEEALQKIRKFRVLTRDKKKMKAILEEQKFADAESTEGDAAESGRLENAHFLVTPQVQDFSFEREHKPVPNINGKWFRIDRGSMLVHMEVLDTEKGEIKATFNLKSDFETEKEVVNQKEGEYPPSTHVTEMTDEIATKFADQLLDTVFPMKVINVASGRIFINRGQDGGLSKGDRLIVFNTGKKLRDPDTGKVLGTTEVEIGKAKVLRVNPKFTIAKMSETESGQSVEKGYILRKPQKKNENNNDK